MRKIAANPEEWVRTYEVFESIPWASELFAMGLNREEQVAVRDYLNAMGIAKIRLEGTAAYRALALSGIEALVSRLGVEVERQRKGIERELKAAVRFERTGFTVSGYKRGWPFTTYYSEGRFYHKVYDDDSGRFEVIHDSRESTLRQGSELLSAIYATERRLRDIHGCWGLWAKRQAILARAANLEKHSHSNGALG